MRGTGAVVLRATWRPRTACAAFSSLSGGPGPPEKWPQFLEGARAPASFRRKAYCKMSSPAEQPGPAGQTPTPPAGQTPTPPAGQTPTSSAEKGSFYASEAFKTALIIVILLISIITLYMYWRSSSDAMIPGMSFAEYGSADITHPIYTGSRQVLRGTGPPACSYPDIRRPGH